MNPAIQAKLMESIHAVFDKFDLKAQYNNTAVPDEEFLRIWQDKGGNEAEFAWAAKAQMDSDDDVGGGDDGSEVLPF